MGKAKRALSVIMAALMLVFTCMTYVPTFAAENTSSAPEVAFVGVDHSPLVVGDTESFSLSTKNADKVQYNVVLKDATGKVVEDLTKGYTAETAGNVPFELKATTVFALGHYNLAVEAKRVSDGKVATYSASLNCVTKDDANRVYANGAMVTDKDSYVLGDKVTVTGINGLAGIAGPYKYRLHIYNATTGEWTKNVVANYSDKIEWTPSAPGTYVLDVHVNTEKSTTWAKYAANPTSSDVYGTYEAWKLKTIVVTDKLQVTKVATPNQNTITLTFNKEVGSVVAANFSVAEKDDEYALSTISKVAVNKNVVTLTLAEAMEDGTAYTVTAKNVPSSDAKLTLDSAKNDVTFKMVDEPASISFKSTTVVGGDDIEYVIKDKDGNDITPNFAADAVTVTRSDKGEDVDLTTEEVTSTQFVVANIAINDTEIETGNTIIKIIPTDLKLTSVGRVTLTTGAGDDTVGTLASPRTYLYKGTEDTWTVAYELLDQNGDAMTPGEDDTVTFKSINPTVAVVDATTGEVSPVAKGTATIVITATINDVKVTKAFTIEVKADPEATSLKVSKTSATLVYGSDLETKITVNVLDQYGNVMTPADDATTSITTTSKNTILLDAPELVADGDDLVWTLAATDDADAKVPASATYTIKYNSLKATVSASLVKQGDFAKFEAVASTLKLDRNADEDSDYYDADQQKATVTVYYKDTNGNYYAKEEGATLDYASDDDKDIVEINGLEVTPVADGDNGTAKVNVYVNSAKIGTLTLTVVDTTPAVTTVKQVKDVISVTDADNIVEKLFGVEDEFDGAFVAYDQYGDKINFTTADITVHSSDKNVIESASGDALTIAGAGNTTLTVVIGSKVYTILVKVTETAATK